MDIFNMLQKMVSRLTRSSVELDGVVDNWIREALAEDAIAKPAPGAWERLLQVITDGEVTRYHGMWILDEPLRDPPVSPALALTRRELQAERHRYAKYSAALRRQITEALWSNYSPSFMAVVNL
ncbi:MAG: hypothetical protein GYB65_07600 [Chloroflexi bacterium]|nr:hypothetical protein [Chloroflexota bacterium]